jgi:hypothetical protein
MRALILLGSLTAAVGATACGTQAAVPFATTDASGQTMVRCEPGQHAVVNSSTVAGRAVTAVTCVSDAPAPVAYSQPAYRPAAYVPEYAPAPQPAPQPVARPAVIRSEAPVYAEESEAPVAEKPTRSWQKRAMVIGGSSGAGAGIGALIGGKKGALIGAAIGGGAGTVYEVTR